MNKTTKKVGLLAASALVALSICTGWVGANFARGRYAASRCINLCPEHTGEVGAQ